MNKNGRPPVEEKKKNYCVKLRPSTREWFKGRKISIGKVLEQYKETNHGNPTYE